MTDLPLRTRRHPRPSWVRHIVTATAIAVAAGAVTGCGDDDTGGGQAVALSEWVEQFDQTCADVYEKLSAPGLTTEDLTAISRGAVADMRAIGQPDELADTAAELLDAIEAASDQTLDDDAIAAIDERTIAAMRTLGVSDACIGDAPGD